MLAVQHAGGIVAVEERPVGAIDADDLLGLDAMPEGKPTLIGEDGRRAAADARRRHRIGVGAEAGRAMRLPVPRSEERRGGTECVSTCLSRWSTNHYTKTQYTVQIDVITMTT